MHTQIRLERWFVPMTMEALCNEDDSSLPKTKARDELQHLCAHSKLNAELMKPEEVEQKLLRMDRCVERFTGLYPRCINRRTWFVHLGW